VTVADNEPALAEDIEVTFDTHSADTWGAGSYSGDLPDLERTIAEEADLHSHLVQQLNLSVHDAADRFIAMSLVDQLDESGYLTISLADAAAQLGTEVPRVERVLKMLQRFDPPGIFAR